jgi:hypothetical protein
MLWSTNKCPSALNDDLLTVDMFSFWSLVVAESLAASVIHGQQPSTSPESVRTHCLQFQSKDTLSHGIDYRFWETVWRDVYIENGIQPQ